MFLFPPGLAVYALVNPLSSRFTPLLITSRFTPFGSPRYHPVDLVTPRFSSLTPQFTSFSPGSLPHPTPYIPIPRFTSLILDSANIPRPEQLVTLPSANPLLPPPQLPIFLPLMFGDLHAHILMTVQNGGL